MASGHRVSGMLLGLMKVLSNIKPKLQQMSFLFSSKSNYIFICYAVLANYYYYYYYYFCL